MIQFFRFNSTKGWLADAMGNYTVDTKCTWLIEAPSPNDRIRIHLKEFATECGWDHLYVFDGDSVGHVYALDFNLRLCWSARFYFSRRYCWRYCYGLFHAVDFAFSKLEKPFRLLHYISLKSDKLIDFENNTWWWWSSGQLTRLLLRRSEFESR